MRVIAEAEALAERGGNRRVSGAEILFKEGTWRARAQALMMMISSCVDSSFGIVGLAHRRITRQADSAALPPGTLWLSSGAVHDLTSAAARTKVVCWLIPYPATFVVHQDCAVVIIL